MSKRTRATTSGGHSRTYGCIKCGRPFDAYPPDDERDTASRVKGELDDEMEMHVICGNDLCKHDNVLYWGRRRFTGMALSTG